MDKPRSDTKKGILTKVWASITETGCGCGPGSSCCGPPAQPDDAGRPDEAAGDAPVDEEPVDEKNRKK